MSNEILNALLSPVFQGGFTTLWNVSENPVTVSSEKELDAALVSGAKRFVPFVQFDDGIQVLFSRMTAVGLVQTGKQPSDYDVCFLPLPPTLVAAWESGCYALWMMSDPQLGGLRNSAALYRGAGRPAQGLSEVGMETYLPIPGVDGCHALRWRPDLIYRERDILAASEVNAQVTELILSHPPVVGRTGHGVTDRVRAELDAVEAMRGAGLSPDLIALVFAEQPIGDPYRSTNSPVGALTLVDTFASWILRAVREKTAEFPNTISNGALWFPMTPAATQWFQARRVAGQTALTASELYRAAQETSQSMSLGRGYYFRGPMEIHFGRTLSWAFGIDLDIARLAGLGTVPEPERVEAV